MTTILLTNDDGIHAPGLRLLKEVLENEFEVFVVAPDREVSASSMALTLNHPLRLAEVANRCWTVNGTTSDCVNIALQKLLSRKPNLVISGMNCGENLAEDIFFSGTVAGAFSAHLYGIKALAVSLTEELGDYRRQNFDYQLGAQIVRQIVYRFFEFSPGAIVANLNIPFPNNGQLHISRLGKKRYYPDIIERNDPRGKKYFWIGVGTPDYELQEGTDVWAIANRYVSLSPINYSLNCTEETFRDFQNAFRNFKLF